LAKQRQPRTPAAAPVEAPQRPALQEISQFLLLEREVELEHRPRMLEALQNKVNAVADSLGVCRREDFRFNENANTVTKANICYKQCFWRGSLPIA
jgi:hypothetical protein